MRRATSVTELGRGAFQGENASIVAFDDKGASIVKLCWTGEAWVGNPIMAITHVDGGFSSRLGVDGDWSYWGSVSGFGKWFLRSGCIPFADKLYAAGLRLQDRIQGRLLDPVGVPTRLAAWFYEFNDEERLVFSNDLGAQGGKTWNGHADLGFEPSPENVGHGAVLRSDGGNQSKFWTDGQYEDDILSSPYHGLPREPGWDYVKLFKASEPAGNALGGVPTNVPYTPTKKYLYPTLYGFGAATEAGSASVYYELRWAS